MVSPQRKHFERISLQALGLSRHPTRLERGSGSTERQRGQESYWPHGAWSLPRTFLSFPCANWVSGERSLAKLLEGAALGS